MPDIKSLIAGIIFTFFVAAFVTTGIPAEQQQKVTLKVDGLACPFCAYGMEKKLERLEGLQELDIKINEGLVILYFGKVAKVDKELIANKVKEAGFTPREINIENTTGAETRAVTLNIKGMQCDGCVSKVKAGLSKVKCVKDVSVNLAENKATVLCTGDKKDRENLVQAVKELGFEAKLTDKKQAN